MEDIQMLSTLVEEKLKEYLTTDDTYLKDTIIKSMSYSVAAGGKRVRPSLLLQFCAMCGGNINDALPFAAALEFIHTYSLIHDDLPCMDNDDMRRGKPSNHKAFGEAVAVLSGDALLNFAFEVVLKHSKISPEKTLKALSVLAEYSGINGMIGGQVIDINQAFDTEENLLKMYELKTGALISAACQIGCIVANAEHIQIDTAKTYGFKLGLAFQIIDDILDVQGNQNLLGKKIGSDDKNNKITFVSMFGLDYSKQKAKQLTDDCINLLNSFADNQLLREFTINLLNRNF